MRLYTIQCLMRRLKIMINFSQEIYRVVNLGLDELAQSQQLGKTPKNPLSESHFFSVWITKGLKQHRFERCVVATLKNWQRQARTMGVQAQLKQQFEGIAQTYIKILKAQPDNNLFEATQCSPVERKSLEVMLDELLKGDWQLIDDALIKRKLTVKVATTNSMVICVEMLKQVFDATGQLTKPLSLYVRGDYQGLIDLCHSHNLLLHKVSDYKSLVKFHGEYIIFPDNNGTDLPCIIT